MTMSSKRRRFVRHRLRAAQGGKCCYCGVRMTEPQMPAIPTSETIEHLQRRSDGGDDGLHNLALACFACNNERGAMNWLVYATYKSGDAVVF